MIANSVNSHSLPLKNINVCGITHADLLSSRFNGLTAVNELSQQRIDYKLLSHVHQRMSGKSVTPSYLKKLTLVIQIIESWTGFQSRFYFWTIGLALRKDFRRAKVVHYHILHNSFFRLESLKLLMRIKPSVWTIHDLWITTGHCIQPLDCKQYGHGCGTCPSLGRSIPVRRDRTQHEYRRKVKLIGKLDCNFIVSTNWMKTRVLQNLPINPEKLQVIPFGVDTETFCPLTTTTRSNLRAKYLISNGTFVVFINAHNDEIKGIKIVRELVSITNKLKNVLFILIDESKIFLLDENVLSFRRITSEQKMVDLLNLADLVVVPSLGESFSLLALEAMSCGKAVVTLENSAPHEVTDSSLLFTFTGRNAAQGIYKIIEKTSNDATIVKVEGERNRERVLNRFTIEKHVMEISKLYLRVGENN